MEYKRYSARTPEDWGTLSKENGDIEVISHLNSVELMSSASRWNFRHLITYRLLVVSDQEIILPVLEPNHNDQCPVCKRDQPNSQQKLNYIWTGSLIGDNPSGLYEKGESELMQLPDGFFWVALARAARPDIIDQAKVYPRRERKQVEREGYVSSMTEIPGSSSPVGYSSSEFEAEINEDLDEDEHEARRGKPEEVTVQLMTCFLQHALHLCLLQHAENPIADTEVRPRVERMTTNAKVAGGVPITAEDDGGICRMQRLKHGWGMEHPYLALLEAKRAFKYIHFDDKSGKYSPIVSNEHLAQYLGEAVITWKGNPNLLQDVFLIAATNTFVRFVHFRFGRHYRQYLDAEDEKSQREIISNKEKDSFVYMHSTKWFNLQSREGRRLMLCHVLALLRRHEAESICHQVDVTEESDQSSSYASESGEEDDVAGGGDDYMDTAEW